MAPLILEIVTRGLHHYQPLEKTETTIGRALDNDVILSDPTVAPYHARIVRHDDGALEIINLAEVNPTRVGRRRVDSLVTPKLPVMLEIGRVQVRQLARWPATIAAVTCSPTLTGRYCWCLPAWRSAASIFTRAPITASSGVTC